MTIGPRLLFPTPTWLRLAIVPVLAFLATFTDRNYLADYWHHLARGRATVERGQIVDRDLLTFTVADRQFQDVNWLTQVGYYALHEAGGLALVQLVNSLLIAGTMLLVVLAGRRRSGSLLAGVLAGTVVFLGVWEVLTIRPQTLSMLLFVEMLDLLERSERRPWLLLVLPALVALWANLHGAFPAGIMLVGCFTLASAWRAWRSRRTLALTACLAVCFAAACVNPYGWTVWRYVGGTSAIAYERQIAEWVRPGLDRLIGLTWMATIALVGGLVAWRWWRTRQTPGLRDVLLLGCFLALSSGSVRMVVWWMLVCAPLLAELLVWAAPTLMANDESANRPSVLVGGVFALMVLAVVFSLPGLDQCNPLLGPTRRGPRVEDDLDAVQRQLPKPGRIYSHFEWGEYLSWSAAPRSRIFMDGRIEIYPDDVWEKYSAVTFAEAGWQRVLDEYSVDYLILDAFYHGRTGLLQCVEASPRWQRVCQSRSAVLFVRRLKSDT
jgi:hypothetical protein